MFLIKKDTWHYRFATMFHFDYVVEAESKTLCQYGKYVMYGLFWYTVFASFIGWTVIGNATWMLAAYNTGIWNIDNGNWFTGLAYIFGMLSLIAICGIGIGLATLAIQERYRHWRQKRDHIKYRNSLNTYPERKVKEPSIIMEMWRGFKDKYCPTVQFEE